MRSCFRLLISSGAPPQILPILIIQFPGRALQKFIMAQVKLGPKDAPYLGSVERRLSANLINSTASIPEKSVCNDTRQVYGDGCPPGNDSGRGREPR